MDAIICVTVVLPLLPVTAITWPNEAPAPAGGQLPAAPPASRRTTQAVEAGLGDAVRADRRDRAGGARLRQEVVRVEALALQRDEQVARAQRARVGVHALERARAVADERRSPAPSRPRPRAS